MQKLISVFILLTLLISSNSYADVTDQLNIQEVDGSPTTYPYQLLVSNGSLTDNGDGTATLVTGAGSGGGGSNNVLTSDIGAVPYYNTRSTISEDQTFLFNPTTNTLFISADTAQSGNDNALAVRTVAGANVMNVSHDGSIFGNKLQLSNDLAVLDGGTGLSGGTSGGVPYYSSGTSMASSLLFAANAVVVGGGSGTAPFTITADTTANHVLVSTATSPNFRQLLTQDVSGVQSVASGGTGITSGTTNALPYFATAGRMGSLTADTTAGHVLVSTTTLPNFRQLLTQDIAGVEDVATGGTGMTSGTSGGVPYFITTGRMASSGLLTANGVMLGGGAGTTPTTTTADTVTTHFLAATSGAPAFRQILTSDLVGTFPASGGSPGGSSLQFQINNASSFGGVPLVTADTTRSRIAIGPGTSTLVSLDVAGSFRTIPIVTTDATTIQPDASRSNFYIVQLTGQPRTLLAPVNGVQGQKMMVLISQDSTGSRKIGLHSSIKTGSDVVSYDASTTAGTNDYLGLIYQGVSWDLVSVSKGYR